MATQRKSSSRRAKPARPAKKSRPSRASGAKSRASGSRHKVAVGKARRAKPARPVKAAKSPRPARAVKAAKASRPARAVKAVKAAPAVKTPKAGLAAKAVKAVKAAPAVKSPKAGLAAKGAKPVAEVRPVKGRPAVKGVRPLKASGKPAAAAVVRPLGVLPPESRARRSAGPASGVVRTRVAGAGVTETAGSPAAERLDPEDIQVFEQRLLQDRQRILKEMGHLETNVLKINQRDSSGDLSGYSFHMADAGTDAMEREKAFLFASAEGRNLMEVNEALRRVYRGEYGVCESCGQPIGRGRLEAMPHARLCVVCKSKEERAGRSGQ